MLIGLSLGFAVRVVFAAVEFAGEIIGLQMGLNFAGFFDPVSAAAGTATSRFFGTTIAWLFIVINGHLLVIAALVQSFTRLPGRARAVRLPEADARRTCGPARSSAPGCGSRCR